MTSFFFKLKKSGLGGQLPGQQPRCVRSSGLDERTGCRQLLGQQPSCVRSSGLDERTACWCGGAVWVHGVEAILKSCHPLSIRIRTLFENFEIGWEVIPFLAARKSSIHSQLVRAFFQKRAFQLRVNSFFYSSRKRASLSIKMPDFVKMPKLIESDTPFFAYRKKGFHSQLECSVLQK